GRVSDNHSASRPIDSAQSYGTRCRRYTFELTRNAYTVAPTNAAISSPPRITPMRNSRNNETSVTMMLHVVGIRSDRRFEAGTPKYAGIAWSAAMGICRMAAPLRPRDIEMSEMAPRMSPADSDP